MEELFKQSASFAQIDLFKNYCNLSEKETNDISNTVVYDGEIDKDDIIKFATSITGPINNIRLYSKNRHHFFHTNKNFPYLQKFTNYGSPGHPEVFYEPIELKPVRITKSLGPNTFYTLKDKQIKRHYNNPFTDLTIYKIERWIKKDGDKITIKLFKSNRDRGVNKIYFTKSINSTTITFNLRTGNFNVITYQKIKKTKVKRFYVNSFISLEQAIAVICSPLKSFSPIPLRDELAKTFNDNDFQDAIKNAMGFNDLQTIDIHKNDFIYQWISKFVELKKIKMPNEGERLLTHFYPTERYLKKNNRKLIAAILDRFGVKSKITIKLLHENPNLNMMTLVQICKMFGSNYAKYIGNIPESFFTKKSLNTNKQDDYFIKNALLNDDIQNRYYTRIEIKDEEKDNILKIIINYNSNLTRYAIGHSHDLISMFYDHFKMLDRVRVYYPDLQLRARTYDTFHLEHVELSNIERAIKNEFSIHYIFDEEMIDAIEEPILSHRIQDLGVDVEDITSNKIGPEILTEVFIPKVLKTTEDYLEEGEYMHHCVGGYIEQENSIIISLRHEKERVTCEFDARTRRCIQTQYFTNDPYPSYYETPLMKLKERVAYFSGKFGSIEKVKKRLQINGKEVMSVETLTENNPF